MTILENLLAYIKQKPSAKNNLAPEGFCPNCWGRQEYSGQFFVAVKKRGLDVNRPDIERGWIQDYAEKNLAGIVLDVDYN